MDATFKGRIFTGRVAEALIKNGVATPLEIPVKKAEKVILKVYEKQEEPKKPE